MVPLALLCGHLATLCFTLQYFPQTWHNFKRKSLAGFSTVGIVMKLVGADFLFINSLFRGEPLPVVLYGFFNVVQHSLFMIQFTLYSHNFVYLLFLLLPSIPGALGLFWPGSLQFTDYIKPTMQIASHLPQIYLIWRVRSTAGMSLLTQHLNAAGGILGLIMCFGMGNMRVSTILLYVNSLLQAISIYVLRFAYGAPPVLGVKSRHLNRADV